MPENKGDYHLPAYLLTMRDVLDKALGAQNFKEAKAYLMVLDGVLEDFHDHCANTYGLVDFVGEQP